MMRRTTFLISALLLLILANVLMMSYASPVFRASGEGFANQVNGNGLPTNNGTNINNGAPVNGLNVNGLNTNTNEGYTNYNGSPGGAKAAYQAIGPYDGVRLPTGNPVSDWRYTKPNEPLNGYFPKFEVGPDNLFMFKDNQCKPECCGASFACDGGCVCTTPEQRKYINERGGNRTGPDAGV
jgi:hypothetical protein